MKFYFEEILTSFMWHWDMMGLSPFLINQADISNDKFKVDWFQTDVTYIEDNQKTWHPLSHTQCVRGDALSRQPVKELTMFYRKAPHHVSSAPPELLMEFTSWRTHTTQNLTVLSTNQDSQQEYM